MKREALREQLVHAAQTVLLTESPGGASVRAITGAAGVNVASITTAFGGRSALLDEVFARVIAPINTERESRYAVLGTNADVAEVVRAFIEPLSAVTQESTPVPTSVLRALLVDADTSAHPLDRVRRDPGIATLVEQVQHRLPDVNPDEVHSRVDLAVGAIFADLTMRTPAASWSTVHIEALIKFVAAGISARR